MSKVIKRVATFCFMAVLLIAMIPQTIKADETSDAKKAVYVGAERLEGSMRVGMG